MFKPSKLIYRNSLEETFEKASTKKIDAEEVLTAFHNQKKSESEEKITDITTVLLSQMDTSLSDQDRIIDIESAKNRLEELKQKNNPERKKQIELEINDRRHNTKSLIRLQNSSSVILLENGTKTNYYNSEADKKTEIEEFIKLSPTEQIKTLQSKKNEIKLATDQFKELARLVNPKDLPDELKSFKKLDTKNRAESIKEIKALSANYKKLLENSGVSQKTLKSRLQTFNTLGIKGQKLEFTRLTEALNVPQKDKEFNGAKEKRKEKYPEFQILSKTEKEDILRQIRSEIKTEYQTELIQHKHYNALSKKDIEMMLSTFKGRFTIDTAEMCLDYLDSSMDSAAAVAKEASVFPQAVLEHFDWDNITFFDKKKLLGEKGTIEQYTENQDHIKYDNKYKEKLTSYLNFKPIGIINEAGLKSYSKWFQGLKVSEKKNIIENSEKKPELDYLEATKQARINANKKFLKLPSQIQKEYRNKYVQADFEEKISILQQIEKLNTESSTEFEEKLNTLVEERLLSENSKARYSKWFTKRLNLSERDEYLSNCNLDKKERRDNLKDFETNILPFVPKAELAKVKKGFYEADFKKRKKLNKKFAEKYIPEDQDVVDIKKQTIANSESVEEAVEALDTNSAIKKDFIKRAEARADKGDRQGALVLYEEVLEMDLNPTEKKKVKDIVNELQEEEDHYESLEEGHFHEIVENEIQNITQENPKLKKQKQVLSMLEEAYDLQYRNEVYYSKTQDDQTRMNQSLDDTYTREANQAFMEHTGDQSLYIDQWGDLEVGDAIEFDIATYDTTQNLPYWMDYFSEMQELPKEKRSDPRFKFKNSKTGENLLAKKFDNEVLYPARTEFIDNGLAPILFDRLKIEGIPSLEKAVSNYLYDINYKERLPKSRKTNLED